MSETAFPPNVAKALDRLTVPPVPTGFSDRLVARVDAGDLPSELDMPLPAKPRFSSVRTPGWRRMGGIGASLTALGLATATAAASGAFGDPVYVPVVSDVLAKADLVQLPKNPKPIKTEKAQPLNVEPPAGHDMPQAVSGKEKVRDLIRTKWQDPEFRKLPKEQRQALMRDALRASIESGDFTQEDLRTAMAEARAERQAKAGQRQDKIGEQFEATQRKLKEKAVANRARYESATPDEQAVMRSDYRKALEMRRRLRELRLQLRDAPPADKIAIRDEIREIRQALSQMAAKNSDKSSEGNPSDER